MAYERGGYHPQERLYAGPAAQRPSPGPGPGGDYQQQPPPRQFDGPPRQQQYGDYQENWGYDYYPDQNGYGADYGPQYQEQAYGRGPPPPNQPYPQDRFGPGPGPGPGRGRPMPMPAGRGAYPPRGGGPPSMGRGGFPAGPQPGRGGRPVPSDRGHMNSNQMGPAEPGFGNPFPSFPGQNQRSDLDEENKILHGMAGMDISGGGGQRAPMGYGGGGPAPDYRLQDGNYAPAPMDDPRGPPRFPPQGPGGGVAPIRRTSVPDHGYGAPRPGEYGSEPQANGYESMPGPNGPQGRPPRNDFGPPSRSMTMPANDGMQRRGPSGMPQRMDTMTYGMGPARPIPQRGPGGPQAARPPPQRMYPPNQGGPQPGPYGGGAEYEPMPPPQSQEGYAQRARASLDSGFNDGYEPSRMSNPEYGSMGPAPGHENGQDPIDPYFRARSSADMHPGPRLPSGPSPNRPPDLSRTKSQPDLRNPSGPIFEMAGDIPPLPTNGAQQRHPQGNYGGPADQMPPRQEQQGPPGGPLTSPLAPSGMSNQANSPGHPGMTRPNSDVAAGPSPAQAPAQAPFNPDALPSHPTPVRPGLMAGSMVSMVNRPAPVRTYTTNSPPAPSPQPQPQPPPPNNGGGAPEQQKLPPVTTEELERLRMILKNDPNDQDMALRLGRRLIEAADVLIPNAADPKTRARTRERYLVDAHKVLKKLASSQNPDAMFLLADGLGKGLFGHEPDHKEAFTLYQSAAKLGHPAAAYRTAVCCEIGSDEGGTRKDPLKAMQWYRRAATLGDTPAMYKLGMVLLKGLLGQPKNPREAVGWLKRAAERADAENPHALHELGLLYESAAPNDAILRDEHYAFTLFKQAADLGYKFSQFRLGAAFEYGLLGCPVDPRLSIMFYSKAAAQEEHQSELALSGWYLTGSEGVLQQSDTEAYLWARKAAMARLAKAEYAMGYFTEVGIGVPANLEDAKRWYWRAAAQDFPKARERLEDLKRVGRSGPRQRERISRSKVGKQQEGECSVM